MQFVGRMFTSVSEFYKDINPATLSGAIDVVVVRDTATGSLACSPFHVRFGKLQVLRPHEKAVDVRINGRPAPPGVRMKAGEAGEAFFVLPVDANTAARVSPDLLTSPVAEARPPSTAHVEPLLLASGAGSDTEDTLGGAAATSAPALVTRAHSDCGEDAGAHLAADGCRPGRLSSARAAASDVDEEAGFVQRGAAASDSELETSAEWRRRRVSRGAPSLPFASELPPAAPHAPPTAPAVPVVAPIVPPVASGATHAFNESPPLSTVSESRSSSSVGLSPSSRLELVVDGVVLCRDEIMLRSGELADLVLTERVAVRVDGGETTPLGDMLPALLLRLFGSASDLQSEDSRSSDVTAAQDTPHPAIGSAEGSADSAASDARPDVPAGHFSPETTSESAQSPELPSQDDSLSLRLSETTLSENSKAPMVADNAAESVVSEISSKGTLSEDTKRTEGSRTDGGQKQQGTAGGRWWWSGGSTATDKQPSPLPEPAAKPAAPVVTRASLRPTAAPEPTTAPAAPAPLPAPAAPAVEPSPPPPEGKHIKSLRLPHELLAQLDLQPGANSISFTVTTRLQGTATCSARVFLWPSDAALVVSDVDGTITKSDALGHILTMVGRDWTHPDIAGLYTRIAANGYRMLYLTSRSLGMAETTRSLIRDVGQGAYTLPDGPVLMSPDRLLAALRREVVTRTPQDFKIACLRDVAQLFAPRGLYGTDEPAASAEPASPFTALSPWAVLRSSASVLAPPTHCPFWAGFGNRHNDALAYLAAGVPAGRIFIVNASGTVAIAPVAGQYAGSYARLAELADAVFPPVTDAMAAPSAGYVPPRGAPLAPRSDETPFGDYWFWHAHAAASVVALESGSPKRQAAEGATPSDIPRFRLARPQISETSPAPQSDGTSAPISPHTEGSSQAADDEEEAVPMAQAFFTG